MFSSGNSDDHVVLATNIAYAPLEEVESINNYGPGGFYPACIDEIIHGRFHIVHKLGHGRDSTTWLVLDQRTQNPQKHRALEIFAAREKAKDGDVLPLLMQPSSSSPPHVGQSLIRPVLEHFTVTSPNGQHRCLVLPLAATNLTGATEGSSSRLFHLPTARAIVAQLIQGIAFLHAKGVVHGDIHPQNILLRDLESLDDLSVDEIYQKFNPPRLEPVQRLDGQPLTAGVPEHVAVPMWLEKPSDKIAVHEAAIFLTGLGESFRPADTSRYQCDVPVTYCPPEHLLPLKAKMSPASDVWMLGCTIWTIYSQRSVFDSWFMNSDRVLAEIVDVIGMPPRKYWEEWKDRRQYWKDNGAKAEHDQNKHWDWRIEEFMQKPRRDGNMEVVPPAELTALMSLLRSILVWKPEQRPSMEVILRSAWMQQYGSPALRMVGSRPKV